MPVFDFAESSGTSLELVPRNIETQFGDGYVATAADGLNDVKQVWDVAIDDASETAADEIEAIVRPIGRAVFDWTPPRHTAPLKFRCTSFNRTNRDFNTFNFRLRFEQWFQP